MTDNNKPNYRKIFWDSYKNLPKRTRIIFGVSCIVFSLVGMKFSENLENTMPNDNTNNSNNSE